MEFIQFWIAVAILVGLLFTVQPVDRPDCAPDGGEGCQVAAVASPEASPDASTAAKGWVPVEANGVFGVIVPSFDADEFDPRADNYWTPEQSDIDAAEAALLLDQGALDHFRQYFGTVEDGEQEVLIYGLRDPMGTNWYRETIMVLDGGDCYFHAIYDGQSDSIENFYFSGHA